MATAEKKLPQWTVLYNIISPLTNWIGTGWEFFDDEKDAQKSYDYQLSAGNVPTMRPYNHQWDQKHLGAIHRI